MDFRKEKKRMPLLSDRTASFTDSVIRRMTRISNQYGAINLSQGFPDFAPPKPITDRLSEIADVGPHQYALTWGAQNFREALAAKHEHFSGLKVDPDSEIVVTCGSTEAMMASMMSVVNPGDKVIVFSPFYENYGADTILSGAEPIFVPLVPPEFKFDAEVLEDGFRAGAKAIVICNPSNPCGKVFTEDELRLIGSLAIKYDAWVITDEVYEHILYEPNRHVYMATLPGMRERTITCNSLSKTYSITGWRLGYVIAPGEVIDRIKKVHDFLTVGAAAPLMEAATVGLKFGDEYYKELQDHYTHMKELFTGGLKNLGIPFTDPQGAYYVLMDISEFGYADDNEFCVDLAKKVGVGAVPGSSFFREPVNNMIRFHFAKQDATLLGALDRLSDIRSKMAGVQRHSVCIQSKPEVIKEKTQFATDAAQTSSVENDAFKESGIFRAPKVKILVADDNDINRAVIGRILKDTGIQIDEAFNGLDCTEKYVNNDYDIILMDHMMPVMDGLEAVRRIRALTRFKGNPIPIIALTANSATENEHEYVRHGFDACLSKPVRPAELMKLLRRLLPEEKVVSNTIQ